MDGLVIGLDLNDDYTQICCYDKEKSWTIQGRRHMRLPFWEKG